MNPHPTVSAPAVFLDRDGTIMHDVHYCADPALVRLYPGARESLRALADAGFRCVIITNQSGIGRGILTEAQFAAVQAELLRQLDDGALDPLTGQPKPHVIAATYHCPDLPTPASPHPPRRKPEPGMVLEAARELALDFATPQARRRSWFVGDRGVDVECGQRAGTRTIRVQTGHGSNPAESASGSPAPDFLARDLSEAVRLILAHTPGR